MTNKSRRLKHTNVLPFLVLTVVGVILLAPFHTKAARLDNNRNLVKEWVELQVKQTEVSNQWQEQKLSLKNRITLLTREKAQLQEQIEAANKLATQADKKRQDLLTKETAYLEANQTLSGELDSLKNEIASLQPLMPQPLVQQVANDMANLSEPLRQGDSTQLTEQLVSALRVLSTAAEFNQQITRTDEIKTKDNGEKVKVQVLYFGLAQAFFVSQDQSYSGVGLPSADGWQWQANNELSPIIAKAIKVHLKQDAPSLVPLPMTLSNIGGSR